MSVHTEMHHSFRQEHSLSLHQNVTEYSQPPPYLMEVKSQFLLLQTVLQRIYIFVYAHTHFSRTDFKKTIFAGSKGVADFYF